MVESRALLPKGSEAVYIHNSHNASADCINHLNQLIQKLQRLKVLKMATGFVWEVFAFYLKKMAITVNVFRIDNRGDV